MTPIPLSTRYSTPTETIQMKNSAIERTSEIFRADHVSMWRSCSRARRGPRPPALAAGPRPLARAAPDEDASGVPEVPVAVDEAAAVDAPAAAELTAGAVPEAGPLPEGGRVPD